MTTTTNKVTPLKHYIITIINGQSRMVFTKRNNEYGMDIPCKSVNSMLDQGIIDVNTAMNVARIQNNKYEQAYKKGL